MWGVVHKKNFKKCVGDHTQKILTVWGTTQKLKKNFEKIKNKKFEKNFNYNVM